MKCAVYRRIPMVSPTSPVSTTFAPGARASFREPGDVVALALSGTAKLLMKGRGSLVGPCQAKRSAKGSGRQGTAGRIPGTDTFDGGSRTLSECVVRLGGSGLRSELPLGSDRAQQA